MKTLHPGDLLVSLLENRLTKTERLQVEAHLETCAACREELNFLLTVFTKPEQASVPELEPDSNLAELILSGEMKPVKTPAKIWSLSFTSGLSAAAVLTGVLFGNWFYTLGQNSQSTDSSAIYTISTESGTDLDAFLNTLEGETK